jgi:hypothetical protein
MSSDHVTTTPSWQTHDPKGGPDMLIDVGRGKLQLLGSLNKIIPAIVYYSIISLTKYYVLCVLNDVWQKVGIFIL